MDTDKFELDDDNYYLTSIRRPDEYIRYRYNYRLPDSLHAEISAAIRAAFGDTICSFTIEDIRIEVGIKPTKNEY